MSEIDSIISDIRSESVSGTSLGSFDKLFNDRQYDVDDIINNNKETYNETESVMSTPSQQSNHRQQHQQSNRRQQHQQSNHRQQHQQSNHRQQQSNHQHQQSNRRQQHQQSNRRQQHQQSNRQHQQSNHQQQSKSYRSANSRRAANSNTATKVSALTHENLMKKQEEEGENKDNTVYKKSIHGSVKSFNSDTDYSTLNNYKNSLNRKVKTRHPLELTGSPNEVIERIDDMVRNICEEHNVNIRSEMYEKHRDAILIQVFLNTMNSSRKDIARACKESMTKSSQKKTPCLS